MSLLGRLVRLNTGTVPLEDFFTEVVGHLLRTHPALCRSWLRAAGLAGIRDDQSVLAVRTQRVMVALEDHQTASRPDIEIELSGEEPRVASEVVFVESKIASGEGAGQLRRYAELLAALDGPAGRTLLYVTRGYDPKDPEEITGGGDGPRERAAVRFFQGRWSDFYRSLAEYQTSLPGAGSDLIAEVMSFMEEQGMARNHRLSGADLEALFRMPRALSIIEETVADATARLQRFAGRRPKSYGTAIKHVREMGLYSIACNLGPDESWRCGFGYALDPDFIGGRLGLAQSDYPAVRAYLYLPPETTDRAERAVAMREMAERWGWTARNLESPGTLSEITRAKSLVDILPEDDHVAAIEAFFSESIAQFEEFRAEYPDLPWGPER